MPATTVNRLLPITLRQLQVFLAIAKTESIGLAAESLTMSKSAVSQALSELETRLGVQLFDRNRGRIFLTAEGRRMICLLYTSPSPRDVEEPRMPASA